MITQRQLGELSSKFGIDKFTVFREYLQLVFLNNLYKEKRSERIYFKGGTCLHFLYNSPRFSEDLDFSTTLLKEEIKNLLQKVMKNVHKEIPVINLVFVYSGKKSLRYKIKYQGKEFKYPQTIRIDFSFEKPILKPAVSRTESKIPVGLSPLILHLTKEEVLAEKIRAFLVRKKGRDLFDLWYLFGQKIPLKEKVLNKKLEAVNLKFEKKNFLKKIEEYPLKKLGLDLTRFLPRHYRKVIPKLQEEIICHKAISFPTPTSI